MSNLVTLGGLMRLKAFARDLKIPLPDLGQSQKKGNYNTAFKGRGLEFDHVRPYLPGDDYRNLDWRVTARSGKLHSKIFSEEREHSLLLWVDGRPSMQFGTRRAFKWVAAAEVAATLAWAYALAGNAVGGGVLGKDRLPLPPLSGEAGALKFLQLLLRSQDKQEIPLEAWRESNNSLLAIISDFSDWDDILLKRIKNGRLLFIMISDPLETALPESGCYAFSDGESWLGLDCDNPRIRQEFAAKFLERQQNIESQARSLGANFLHISTADNPHLILRQYSWGRQ